MPRGDGRWPMIVDAGKATASDRASANDQLSAAGTG
jgi:hypothetical protein